MDASFLSNLLAWSAQIAVIVAIGGLGAAALRGAAAVRYAYWRVLLVLCLLLPWVQGRHEAAGLATASTTVAFDVVASPAAEAAATGGAIPWTAVIAALMAAGAGVRLAWLAMGLARLRRLRVAGEPARPGEAHEDLQRVIGARAEIRFVPGIRQPATFGAMRPIVLLPDTLRERGWPIQRAVISHELFHVQRRDWIWAIGEEIVRAVFWFHPAMWWAVSRVQLAREEAVDELVVRATGQRRTYLQALLAFADEAPLAPAAAFARRRHLYRRMMLISKEAVMSSRRVVATCAVMALVVSAGGWYAVRAFPLMQAQDAQGLLNEPGPVELRAKAITPENPIPRRVYAAPVYYPPEAAGSGAFGTVMLRVVLNELGRVAELRRMGAAVSGGTAAITDAFVRSAADGVRLWIFDAPADGPIAFNATLRFSPDAEATLLTMGAGVAFTISPGTVGAIAGPGRGAAGGRRGGAGAFGAAPPPPPPPPPPAWAAGAIRVGGAVMQPKKVTHVNPMYPAIAQSAKVQGVVIIEALIDPQGRVAEARVIRSIPLLDQAALDAVKQWEFTPTLLNGVPTSVIMTVTVNFSLT